MEYVYESGCLPTQDALLRKGQKRAAFGIGWRGGYGTLDAVSFDNVTVTVGTTPFVSGVTPVIGTIGTPVTINGSNFGSTQGGTSTVKFNGALATSITSWSGSQIVATVGHG